jgi:hypothetical protein
MPRELRAALATLSRLCPVRAGVVGIILGVLAVAGPSWAVPPTERDVHPSVSDHPRLHYTEWGSSRYGIEYCDEPSDGCRPKLEVRVGSRIVARPQVDEYGSATYDWRCAETGAHRWTLTVSHASGPAIVRRGTFRVPRCAPWRPQRITRGRAASFQANSYRSEFVSRVRCNPVAHRRGSRAATWRCSVTHNNTYRECTEVFVTTFRVRVVFGDVREGYRERRSSRRCRYF